MVASPALAEPVSGARAHASLHGAPARHLSRAKRARHTDARRGGHQLTICIRRVGCSTDTGGTPPTKPSIAAAPSTPRTPTPADRTPVRLQTPKPTDPGSQPATDLKPRTAAENTAAVIAGVLASPCPNTELTPSTENLPLVRAAVLCLINRERAEHNVSPLTLSARLEAAAESHCAELISVDYFAHVAPDGETPVDRIRRTGYIPGPSVGYVIGENLAWGTYSLSTPQSIVSAWIASPGHLANILESQYTETGIGIVPAVPASVGGGAPGASYAQEFGVIIH